MAKAMKAATVRALKVKGFHCDKGEGAARGLYVEVTPRRGGGTGFARSWAFRFVSPVTRKTRWMGLGSCDCIGLAEARDLAKAARRLVTLGADPIEHRKATVEKERDAIIIERASTMTFAQCASAYLKMHSKTWRNDKHRQQWASSLDRASTAFGLLNVAAIDTPIIAKFLEPIWASTPESGSRIRGRVEKVLDWASARKFRSGENPARWTGHLEHLLHARPKAEHHAAMPFDQLPAFMARLRDRDSISARALELLILTATRTGETINAKWNEIDLEARQWTIPAERMKAGKDHTIPLSDRAVALLTALPRLSAFVFPGGVEGKALSNMALLQMLRGMDANGFKVHGFRSTFRDWAGDCTSFDRETIEHALAHNLPNKVEAAYRRGTALQKRALLMAAWSNHCAGEAVGSNVTPLTKRA